MTRRQEKAQSLILRELSDLINRKVQDPRVRGVHIVSVDISPDFHLARVFFSTLNQDQNPDDVQKGLDSAKAFLRRELKKVIELRVVPELAFHFDPSIREGDQMLNLLRKINKDN
ncbi:MAG: 30S ribosome-binding factor RbfA [Candidatus Riflebacteria bacterium]